MNGPDYNAISKADFIARYDHVFEHSPWVVERTVARRPVPHLHSAMMAVLEESTQEERLALIKAHPELAGKAAIAGDLTPSSAAEQSSAALDRLSPAEYALFHKRNAAYREKFGFPFVICVKLTDKQGILDAMQRRLGNEPPEEIATAIEEIGQIARLRLEEQAL